MVINDKFDKCVRYLFNRGFVTVWKNDPSIVGTKFRSIVITSDSFSAQHGIFQVFALEGQIVDIRSGVPIASNETLKTIHDADLNGLDAAARRFEELFMIAKKEGYGLITFTDVVSVDEKPRALAGSPSRKRIIS